MTRQNNKNDVEPNQLRIKLSFYDHLIRTGMVGNVVNQWVSSRAKYLDTVYLSKRHWHNWLAVKIIVIVTKDLLPAIHKKARVGLLE